MTKKAEWLVWFGDERQGRADGVIDYSTEQSRLKGASIKHQRVMTSSVIYSLWPSFSPSTLCFPFKPLFSLCSRPSLSLFVSCKGQHVQKEWIFRMALILLLWFFHLPQPHPSLSCSHPSTCFELGQRRGWKETRGTAEGARDAVTENTWCFPAEVRPTNNQNLVKINNFFKND